MEERLFQRDQIVLWTHGGSKSPRRTDKAIFLRYTQHKAVIDVIQPDGSTLRKPVTRESLSLEQSK